MAALRVPDTVALTPATAGSNRKGAKAMYPSVLYDVAKIKIAEDLATAEEKRQRRAREAASMRPQAIDTPNAVDRIRGWLRRGSAPSVGLTAEEGA